MKKLLFVDDANFEEAIEVLNGRGITSTPAQPDVITDCADRLLFEMGVPQNVRGHEYFIAAIAICVQTGVDISFAITKDIYPVVGKMYRVEGWDVERDMRVALESTWRKGLNPDFTGYFQRPQIRPTNTEFLSVASRLTLERLEKESFGD